MSRQPSKDYSQLPLRSLITRSKEYHGGTPVFRGTRVPVKTMFDYLEEGEPLDAFLKQHSTVTREHAAAVLAKIGERLKTAKI